MESHVFSWSRSWFSKLLESELVFKIAGVGVGFQNCWSRSWFSKLLESKSVLKKWGVGVNFLNLNNLWEGVGILKNLPTPQPCTRVTEFQQFMRTENNGEK